MRRALLLALAAAAAGFSPFQAEEPNVREGNERLAAGEPQAALPRYDAAEKGAGPRAEIDYDRGIALHKLGKSTEARDAYRRALERGPGELASRIHQNLGNALAAAGDREGAIAAFSEALRKDPGNEDARFDLEVLLRRKQAEAARQEPQQQGGQPRPQGQPRQGQPQGQQGAQARADGAERRPDPGKPNPAEPRAQTGGAAREAEPRDRDQAASAREGEPERLSREDASRILDAFRAREKAMPPAGERRRARGGDADRDW